jgi:hypothetical protein
MIGDPVLVVGSAGEGDAGGLGTGEVGVGLESLDDLLGGARALGLGEEGLDPGLVDEVEEAAEGRGEEKVEEDAGKSTVSGMKPENGGLGKGAYI